MSRYGSFVDTGFLRNHISELRREKQIALELHENVKNMKGLSDPTVSYQYDSILRNIEQLIEYFDRMAKSLSHIDDEAVQLSQKLGSIIENDTELTEKKVSSKFVL